MNKIRSFIKRLFSAPPYVVPDNDYERLRRFQKQRIKASRVDRQSSYKGLNSKEQDAVSNLINNGYHLCENFLTSSEVSLLNQAVKDLKKSSKLIREVGKEGGAIDWLYGNFPRGIHRIVEDSFRNSVFLKNVIEAYTTKNLLSTPEVIFQELSLSENNKDIEDIQTVLHADRFYSSVKVFYMVNDHTPENGAFWFSPGSHVMDDFRIKYELDYALRVSKQLTGKKAELPKDLLEFGRSTINHELAEKFPPQQLTGKKNSLLIVDVSGFHKRGLIMPGQNRQTIRMIYHYMHAPVWSQSLFKLLGKEPGRYLS